MTANMTNRDAKGKFVKAPATQTFNVGDRVICPRLTGHGTGTVGKSIRLNSPQFADIRTVRVVWDTGGESHYTPAELQPAPAPCPFKVGDWVYHLTCKPEERGTVEQVFTEAVATRWEDGTVSTDEFEAIRKVENTAAKSCRVDVDLLIYERDGLLDEVSRLKAEANERANAYSQKVQGVRAELIDALSTADAEHSALLEARKQLEDIAALRRSESIMRPLKENASFADAIDAVLEGKVAA